MAWWAGGKDMKPKEIEIYKKETCTLYLSVDATNEGILITASENEYGDIDECLLTWEEVETIKKNYLNL